jgi:PTS system fructose-specific IIC component
VYESDTLAAQIFNIGQDAFGVMVGVLSAYIAYSVADRPGIAPGFVGGLIASRIGAGFLGGLLSGLIAGYLIAYAKQLDLPRALRSLMSVLFIPVFGTLIVGLLMVYVVGPPATWLNTTFTNLLSNLGMGSKLVLGLVLGAMMAFDMGGPVNKAAYFFAMAASEAGNWSPLAAVMVGGMVPPLAIALAMLASKNKFTKDEQGGLTGCFIGAATFITEFAIPYAAADPVRVIPSIMAGSAVGAAASMLMGVTLQAPHGGLFVFALSNSPLLWVLSILIGGVAGAAVLVALKPALSEAEANAEAAEGNLALNL